MANAHGQAITEPSDAVESADKTTGAVEETATGAIRLIGTLTRGFVIAAAAGFVLGVAVGVVVGRRATPQQPPWRLWR